ncbi:hypothetical protein INT45_005826 [Circinella minor]|uniref:AIG1-type G domain-containing protein n=1 Tax=Circinella minor TaxID=1195481 RepID=A0A8H7VFZ0_9FUNG|nr:hypothetical protein INT45_005826 [Circinella minor]
MAQLSTSPSIETAWENPFFELESDYDPIMIAAKRNHQQQQQQEAPPILVPSDSTATTASSRRRSFTTEDNPLKIIALGKTGDGKSSLLNDILGKEAFKHKRSVKSQTAEVQESSGFWSPLQPHMPGKGNFGCHVHAIDTPGFGDSQLRDGQFIPAIRKKIIEVAGLEGGLHCILLAFKISNSMDTIMTGLRTLSDLMKPNKTFWKNVILVFTHADPSTINRYRSNKVTLKTKVGPEIKDYLELDEELPMVFISTQKHMCSYFKGMGDCDCVHGSRYHADCRRRFYEQVWKRRNIPFQLDEEEMIQMEEEEEEEINTEEQEDSIS